MLEEIGRVGGCGMVSRVVVETLARPARPVAVTFGGEWWLKVRGWDGTHELPSGRMLPSTVSPSVLVTVTAVTVPLVTCVPISAEIGTRCACAAGVTVRDGGGPATA